MTCIRITHTHADGTILTGSSKGDGVYEIVRQHGFRWSPHVGIYIRGSRDHRPQLWRIESAKKALEDAGFTVEVDIDDCARPTADVEADRADRLADRQAALEDKAARLGDRSAARLTGARQTYDLIPMGQPILVGHHSEGRHRRDLARAEANMRKGIEVGEQSEEAARKAKASEQHQQYRETGPVTERRIQKLEAEERGILRDMEPCAISGKEVKPEGQGKTIECRLCWNEITLGVTVPDHGRRISQATGEQRLAEVRDALAYWRRHLQELIDNGYRKWGPDDFSKGDYVLAGAFGWAEVLRVNKKSLTIPSGYSWTHTVPYDEVRGKRTAVEMKEGQVDG